MNETKLTVKGRWGRTSYYVGNFFIGNFYVTQRKWAPYIVTDDFSRFAKVETMQDAVRALHARADKIMAQISPDIVVEHAMPEEETE